VVVIPSPEPPLVSVFVRAIGANGKATDSALIGNVATC
jgi:hypothetical protein